MTFAFLGVRVVVSVRRRSRIRQGFYRSRYFTNAEIEQSDLLRALRDGLEAAPAGFAGIRDGDGGQETVFMVCDSCGKDIGEPTEDLEYWEVEVVKCGPGSLRADEKARGQFCQPCAWMLSKVLEHSVTWLSTRGRAEWPA